MGYVYVFEEFPTRAQRPASDYLSKVANKRLILLRNFDLIVRNFHSKTPQNTQKIQDNININAERCLRICFCSDFICFVIAKYRKALIASGRFKE